MLWRIEVRNIEGVFDCLGGAIQKSITECGISSISKVSVDHVYYLEGKLTKVQAQKIADTLLSDPITQNTKVSSTYPSRKKSTDHHIIEIAYNIGVMDPVEESTMKGIRDLGFKSIEGVRTAKQYHLIGKLTKSQSREVVNKVLANKLIQHEVDHSKKINSFVIHAKPKPIKLQCIDLSSATDKELISISEKGQLFLSIDEMRTIQKHFKAIGRNPTDIELETLAQTWSEHCFHKTFRGNIRYTSTIDGKTVTKNIKNLLKTTIVKATEELDKDWCVSVFHDNAGVIKFDDEDNVCFKVETHNHPSALEPYGGSSTGIGGVIRDTLGTGLGAKPICNTDIFCFAPPDFPADQLPPGTLHPKRVMKGVVSGVRDYGNKMGIPTINGSILFDNRFVGNPLVYCGNVGIMPKDKVFKKALKGDLIIAVGGKTGRDGIHGATFSSGELTTESETVSSGAVQIGNPIEEKKVLDALLKARDLNLYTAITDCGAGGFSSAVGEMGEELGVRVQLDAAPLKYQGLSYVEIWISESQERMVMSVSKKNKDAFLKVFADENVEATVIGEFTGNKKLELYYQDVQVCQLDMDFLYDGNPRVTKQAKWVEPKVKPLKLTKELDLNENLKKVFSHYNVCSKEWVVRQYDHEVQGTSIIKPFVGLKNDGPSDASVIAPKFGSYKGIAVSNGINVRYGMIDPYWMAGSCIDEALRGIVAVGGDVSKVAILDNFCWGNPDKSDRLGSLVRCAQGCYKFAVGYGVPYISGKDSLYNEYAEGNKSIAIPGTILISAIGIIEDVTKSVTMDFKNAGNIIYVVGETFDEMGGSIYCDTLGMLGDNVPKVNTKKASKIFDSMHKAVVKGLVRSIHDCSEGGIAVALSEMAFSGGLGAKIECEKIPHSIEDVCNEKLLFSESNSRFIVEVEPRNQKQFESALKGLKISNVGVVTENKNVEILSLEGINCINLEISDIKESWQKPLRW